VGKEGGCACGAGRPKGGPAPRLAREANALALLLVCGTAFAETRPHYGGTVEATLLGAPASLDPTAARTHAEATVATLVFDTLYRIGPEGVPQPHLAAALPVAVDATTVRIEIRKNVKLHDGTVLTPQDVAASLDRARTAVRWVLAPVTSISADADAVELELRAPADDLVMFLSLPQTAITKDGRPPGAKVIGSGPFKVKQLDGAHHRLELEAFDDHFAGRPYIDQLVLRWYDTPDGEARRFETGNAQLSARGVAAFAGGQPTFKAEDVEGPAALLVYVGFGRAHADILADPSFRHSLDLVLARAGLSGIGSGERVVPSRLPVPIEAGAPPLVARSGDVDAAMAELARSPIAALAPGRRGGLTLEVLVEDTRPDDREIAERVLAALDQLGIHAKLSAVTAQVLRDRIAAGRADLYIGQIAEPVTAQPAWWAAAFGVGNDDTLITQLGLGPFDAAAAAKAFEQRLPIVPLMFRSIRLWHRSDIRGVSFDATGRPSFADLFLFGAPVPTRGHP
jgi:peptide/nickel transport system substrate-binding protein